MTFIADAFDDQVAGSEEHAPSTWPPHAHQDLQKVIPTPLAGDQSIIHHYHHHHQIWVQTSADVHVPTACGGVKDCAALINYVSTRSNDAAKA